MKWLTSPILAFNKYDKNAKLYAVREFKIQELAHSKIIGQLIISIIPKPLNNPVIFRQYELQLPKEIKILNYQLPKQLSLLERTVNSDYYKIIVEPKSNVLIIDKKVQVVLNVTINPIVQGDKYSVFILPIDYKQGLLSQINQKSIQDPNKILIYSPLNDHYTGIAVINKAGFGVEVQKLQNSMNKLSVIYKYFLINVSILVYKQLAIIILVLSLVMYNLIWLYKRIPNYSLKQ